MLNNRNIVFFGDDWGRHPSTVQHIGRVLARTNRLLWVNALGSRRPRFRVYDLVRIIQRLRTLLRPRRHSETAQTVNVVHPFVLPYYDLAWVRRLNDMLLSKMLRRKMEKLEFNRPILMSGTPLVAGIISTLGETSSHYLCTDDYAKFDGVFRAFELTERVMIERVDCVFATSELLLKKHKDARSDGIFLPQGVDTEHFVRREDNVAEAMKAFPGLVVGFFGIIASWVDVDLIVQCALKYPNVSFVLIGRIDTHDGFLKASGNLHHLGEVPYESLPKYAQAFDVGLIPFIKNDLTVAANPLKMLEYLSMGIAVVSTDLPEVRKFQDVVHVSRTSDEFVENIGIALAENGDEQRIKRRRRAAEFSWTSVVEGLSAAVDLVEKRKV